MIIKALDALQKGYERSINARVSVAILYAVNLLVVLPFAYGIHAMLKTTAGSSMDYDVVMSGFDFTVISDFARAHSEALGTLFGIAGGAAVAYVLANVFLSGGIIATVRRDGMIVTTGDFFSGAAAYCGRFLRLAGIVSAGGLLVAIPVLMVVVSITGIFEAGTRSEIPGTIGAGVLLFMSLLLGVLVLMVYDYARIDAVLTDGTSMRKSAWRGLRFVYRRLGRTIKLQIVLILLFLVLATLYILLTGLVGTGSTLPLLLTVALQQLFILQRIGLRVFGFAAESALYRELNPEGGGIPGWDTGHAW